MINYVLIYLVASYSVCIVVVRMKARRELEGTDNLAVVIVWLLSPVLLPFYLCDAGYWVLCRILELPS